MEWNPHRWSFGGYYILNMQKNMRSVRWRLETPLQEVVFHFRLTSMILHRVYFFRMWKLFSLCALVFATETLSDTHDTRGGQSLGRGAGRMRGRGVASLASRQRGAIIVYLFSEQESECGKFSSPYVPWFLQRKHLEGVRVEWEVEVLQALLLVREGLSGGSWLPSRGMLMREGRSWWEPMIIDWVFRCDSIS